jgi:protein-tyrosine phosphatase
MIDLHSHILPGLDDGPEWIEESVAMARMAVGDGIVMMACTPHILQGVYDNNTCTILRSIRALQKELHDCGIGLELALGADVHVAPDLPKAIDTGEIPTLNGSRYFLLEPPHHVLPPRLEVFAARLIKAGLTPIITHPERLTWISQHYAIIARLNAMGCMMQITAGSVTGAFGRTVRYYAERLLDEGRVDILASDAHNTNSRPPVLSRAREIVAQRVGHRAASRMVMECPAQILTDKAVVARGQSIGSRGDAGSDTRRWSLGRLLRTGT